MTLIQHEEEVAIQSYKILPQRDRSRAFSKARYFLNDENAKQEGR